MILDEEGDARPKNRGKERVCQTKDEHADDRCGKRESKLSMSPDQENSRERDVACTVSEAIDKVPTERRSNGGNNVGDGLKCGQVKWQPIRYDKE